MNGQTPSPFTLREDQERAVREAQQKLRASRSVMIAAPTGSGKTVILAEMAARALRKDLRSVLLVHRQELVKQSRDKILQQSGLEPGIVWKDRREWEESITILAQSTIANAELPRGILRPDLLIIDEAHHSVAPSWLHTIERLAPRFLVGFSATPFRQDKEPLHPEPFKEIIRPVTPHELMGMNILCPAVIESPVIHGPDGAPQSVNQARNLPQIYLEAVRYAIAGGRKKIILYVSQNNENTPIQVMGQTLRELEKSGITAGAITQHHSAKRRNRELEKFANAPGASVLLNYIALTEGTDLPMVDCVILGRHTSSESTIIQMIGRGLRRHEGKRDCLVLDYSGRRDMENIIHYWRIDEPREKGAGSSKQPERKDPEELLELSVRFANRVSPWGRSQVEYSWFRPYETRPLLVLPLRPGENQAERYLTVEPLRDGEWRVSNVGLNASGPAPVTKRQNRARTEGDALLMVRSAIGEQAPRLRRDARWRMEPPSENQRKAWRNLHRGQDPEGEPKTAGEISDSISKQRFLRKVSPELL